MLLQKLEEVLHLEAAVFRHVSAVDSVSDSVEAELSSVMNKREDVTKGFDDGLSTYLRVSGRKCLAISGS